MSGTQIKMERETLFKWKKLAEKLQAENERLSIIIDNQKTVININQAENAKLIDCVEHYAKIMEDEYGLKGNSVASQLLKELEEK